MVTSMISSPIPTAPGLPLVGNALAYRRNRLALWMQVRETCGDIGLVRLGSRSLLLVSSPELIHAVLVEQADHFEKSPLFRRVMEPILGNGLVTSENAFHKRQRKLIAPAFPHRQLTSLVPLMAQATEHLQSQWQDGEVIDLARQMTQLTLVISLGRERLKSDLNSERIIGTSAERKSR